MHNVNLCSDFCSFIFVSYVCIFFFRFCLYFTADPLHCPQPVVVRTTAATIVTIVTVVVAVNKPGGVGKITTIIEMAGTATVVYLIGRKRKEKNISFEDMAQYNLGPRESRSTCKKNCE